ncbi:MAG: hypothetical protein ACKPE3_33140, partial [Sphaerospermopsis kisseleviana]
YTQINATYNEIKSSEGLSFQLPGMGTSLLIGISAVALIGLVKKWSTTNNNNNGDNQSEI